MSASHTCEIPRNNTNFPMKLYEYFRGIVPDSKYSFLKYYQEVVRRYVLEVSAGSRGLLIEHEMGLGKSILAIALAMDQISERRVLMLLTKSLRDNMRGSIKKYITLRARSEPDYYLAKLPAADLDAWIDKNFSFVSMNASNMLEQLARAVSSDEAEIGLSKEERQVQRRLDKKLGRIPAGSLNGCMVIVDEAHNLFRAITNGSKNALGFYTQAMKSRGSYFVFLTGTPVVNDPFEIVPCFNMIGSSDGRPILPEYYQEFKKLYTDGGKLKNGDRLQNRLFGLMSYVDRKSTPGRALGVEADPNRSEFPEQRELVVVRVDMEERQLVAYNLARDLEKDEANRPGGKRAEAAAMTKPKSRGASTYRVHSRQLSNVFAGDYRDRKLSEIPAAAIISPKFDALLENLGKHSGQLGLAYSQFVGAGGLGALAKRLSAAGWSRLVFDKSGRVAAEDGDLDKLREEDEAEPATAGEIMGSGESTAESGGNDDSARMMTADEYLQAIEAELTTGRTGGGIGTGGLPTGNGKPGLNFTIISGEVHTDARKKIVELFNSPDNSHGELLSLLLVSSTGAEGLDTKRIRHIHILEPYWNYARVAQIIARGVRNDSHLDLPPDEKNVTPYIYLAVAPESARFRGVLAATTDEELYKDALESVESIRNFMDAIHQVSIECMINAGSNCKVCAPTNQQLYGDPYKDTLIADPCRAAREEKVTAKEISIDGVIFHYAADPKSVYDYVVYHYDKTLGGYKRMSEKSPEFERVIAAILAAENASN
jgi:hypothetical protein